MRKLVGPVALMFVPFVCAACASLLSYDDYRERAPDASIGLPDSKPPDTQVVDTKVELDADAGNPPFRPPTRPTGAPISSGKGKTLWFAAKHYWLGSQNHAGVKKDDAWKEWGYDLDKVCTSLDDSTANIGTCLRVVDADPDTLLDGDRCRDNNFGQHVVALVRVYNDDFEKTANDGVLLKGNATWLLRIDDVDEGKDDPFAPAKLYRSSSEKTPPKWDGTDVRSVSAESVTGGDIEKPFSSFPRGYIKDDVWVSGDRESFEVLLPVATEISLPMQLVGGILTVKLDRTHTQALEGILGGAIPTAVLEKVIKPIAVSAGFCPGTPLYESLLKTVRRFPDVYIEGKDLQDVTKTCNGVTLGLGFDLTPIQPVKDVVPAPPPDPGKCGDAG